jgi:hypothetical protein
MQVNNFYLNIVFARALAKTAMRVKITYLSEFFVQLNYSYFSLFCAQFAIWGVGLGLLLCFLQQSNRLFPE